MLGSERRKDSCRRPNKLAQCEICAYYSGTAEHPVIMAYNAMSAGTGYVNLTSRRDIISQENSIYNVVQSAAFLTFVRTLESGPWHWLHLHSVPWFSSFYSYKSQYTA